jgi:hypothetical protein
MGRPPRLHPGDVFRPAKVVAIFRPTQPARLARRLARPPTLGRHAVTLPLSTARIGQEELFAMAALALPDGVHASHRPAPRSPPQSFRPSHLNPVHAGRKSTAGRRIFLGEVSEENPPT